MYPQEQLTPFGAGPLRVLHRYVSGTTKNRAAHRPPPGTVV